MKSCLPFFLFLTACVGPLRAGTDGRFLFIPMAGMADTKAVFPSGGARRTFKDSGSLYGVQTLYAAPLYCIGVLGHFSDMENGDENGYLLTGTRFFCAECAWQPMVGASLEHISVRADMPPADAFPFRSMDVHTRVWAFYPVAGVSFKRGFYRVTPFAGYFKEIVGTVVASEGILTAGQLRNGFRKETSASLDYGSAGTKVELSIGRLLKMDAKVYARFRRHEKTRYTTRSRLDFYLSKKWGLSAKFDTFDDSHQSNTLFFAGAVFPL